MINPGARQHGGPLFIKNIEDAGNAHPLKPINLTGDREKQYSEGWLQDLLFRWPNAFPIEEIDPIFSPLIPVCQELPTAAGPADLLFVNPNGLLTLVECKLWRNPEARREVVGQTLDYAKELNRWSYEDLDAAIRKRTGGAENSLYAIASQFGGELDEVTFVDSVSRNLKRGRFLLLIAGDGIREGVENITNFLQAYGGLHFTFALVEFSVFQLPEAAGEGWIVEPRILARTAEIERAVIRVDHGVVSIEAPDDQLVTYKSLGRKKIVTEQEFLEALEEADAKAASALPKFFEECEEAGLVITRTSVSMIIHWFDDEGTKFNFGTISQDGGLNTNYICESAEKAGDISIGEDYLKGVAELVEKGAIRKDGKSWTWRVVRNERPPPVSDLLEAKDRWLALITKTIERFRSAKAE